jgi:DNA ligase D-like protein (predicted 3'-phosphoesterase)
MKRPLDIYAEKRVFARTPEPAPKVVARDGPLLFVVQKHAARRLHYDFRLELDGVLKSWAVPKGPSLQIGEKRLAVETEDHPFDYASFEGTIPAKEYGAGNVIVWDCGVYSPDEGSRYSFGDREEAQRRIREELAKGKLSFFLRGEKLKGSFALVKTSTDKQWLLLKHKDRRIPGGMANTLASPHRCAVARSSRPSRVAAQALVADARRGERNCELEPGLVIRTEARRLSRARVHRRRTGAPRITARARYDLRLSGGRRGSRGASRRQHDSRR